MKCGQNDTRPTSPGLLGDIEHPTTDAPIELLSFERSSAMDDLSSPCVSILKGGLEQLVQLPDASDTIPSTSATPWSRAASAQADRVPGLVFWDQHPLAPPP